MSKLEELIARLCPDGVEYKPIKEIYRRLKGTPITAAKMKEIQKPKGNIKIFAGGKTIIDAMEDDIPNANITRVPAVLVQSRGVIDVVFYDKPFTFKNEMWAYTSDTVIETKFLYYVLKNNIQTFRDAASGMGSLPQISLKVTEYFNVPVPPLEVQREIVHVLDSFTLLSAELAAELAARQKQYEFYRDMLLTFDDVRAGGTSSIPFCFLSDIADFRNGKGHEQNMVPDGKYIVVNSKFISTNGDVKKYSNDQICPLFKDDILMVMSDLPNGRALAKCYLTESGNKYTLNQRIGAIKTKDSKNVMTKYLFYILNRNKQLLKFDNGVDQTNLKKSDILHIKIPVPPLAEQQRIVDILDRFDALCNDITSGLPAEIEARRKQYEYYRDKLLTFKELKKEA